MSKFIIKGPARLSGEIEVKGAKNLALKVIPASILLGGEVHITSSPNIEDINKSLSLLEKLGALVKKKNSSVEINSTTIKENTLFEDHAKKFRASIMFVGPLLARFGEVKFPHPGGCVIGAGGRPIDLFVEGFKALGAELKQHGNYYYLRASKLQGAEYFFPGVSVTATESLMMTATLAQGTTVLKNCALEPEIKVLADFLNNRGAKIKGAGTPTMVIQGVNKMNGGRIKIIPDRIETGSFAIMAAATGSELTITKCDPDHIQILLTIFDKIGVPYKKDKNKLKIKPVRSLKPYNIKTHEYPGFPTDLQPPYTVLMTQARGTTLIHETIYDRRLLYIDLLSQMGADVLMCDPHRAIVKGPTKLYNRKLTSPDLRAGIALLIASLVAKGATEIDNIYQIERGYENIDTRLKNIGVDIRRNDE